MGWGEWHLLIFLYSFIVTNVGFRPLVFDNKLSEQYVLICQIVVCNNANMAALFCVFENTQVYI